MWIVVPRNGAENAAVPDAANTVGFQQHTASSVAAQSDAQEQTPYEQQHPGQEPRILPVQQLMPTQTTQIRQAPPQVAPPPSFSHTTSTSKPPLSLQQQKGQRFGSWFNSAKHKTMAMFYNIAHSVPTQYPFFAEGPIWLFGHCYHSEMIVSNSDFFRPEDSYYHPHFLRDFRCVLWFTYRKNFSPIAQSDLTTDTGWGCMLRSAQMMLARVFVCKHFGGGTEHKTLPGSPYPLVVPLDIDCNIIKLFLDVPPAPFSIHNIIAKHRKIKLDSGESMSEPLSEWFAPATVANIFMQILHEYNSKYHICVRMYVPHDMVLHRQTASGLMTAPCPQFVDSCPGIPQPSTAARPDSNKGAPPHSCSLFILIPIRLGLEQISDCYIEGLKLCLRLPQSVGIIGGRPRQSLYFLGYQDDQLIFLDPHIVQSFTPEPFTTETYHCPFPQLIDIRDIDPTLALGFYCHTLEDMNNLLDMLYEIQKATANPIVWVQDDTVPQPPTQASDEDEWSIF
ncbi:glycoside hydrolase family 43 protein [Pelomyxa schiedti]|nr:glycoside hydrolase family 43 protein [Pelomyxa schiedti]